MAVNRFAENTQANEYFVIIKGQGARHLAENPLNKPPEIELTKVQKLKAIASRVWEWLNHSRIKDLERKVKRLENKLNDRGTINGKHRKSNYRT